MVTRLKIKIFSGEWTYPCGELGEDGIGWSWESDLDIAEIIFGFSCWVAIR